MHVCPECLGEQTVPGTDDAGDDFLDRECDRCEGSGFVDELEEDEDE